MAVHHRAHRRKRAGTQAAKQPCVTTATAQPSNVPAMVVLVCVPLPLTMAALYGGMALQPIDAPIAAVVGLAATLGYLVAFLPALLVFEPFAVAATLWYTVRYGRRWSEAAMPVTVCWIA